MNDQRIALDDDSSYRIVPLTAFRDNYIWLLRRDDRHEAVIIDPGDARPVLDYLASENLKLVAILATHHHTDHTGGISALDAHTRVIGFNVYGPCEVNTNHPIIRVSPEEEIEIPSFTSARLSFAHFKVIETPGHTRHHVAYYDRNHQGRGALFCGDTLFSAGCGRLFEGTPAQMQSTLARLRALPAETSIYCAHEYTELNLRFALAVEPENQAIAAYAHDVSQRRAAGLPSLPSTLGLECAINPFLRWDAPAVQQAAAHFCGLPLNFYVKNKDDVAVFAAIREWRNTF